MMDTYDFTDFPELGSGPQSFDMDQVHAALPDGDDLQTNVFQP
jgi:hypothetical protein